jgi:modulator of FtsH protease HflC
MSGAVDRSDRLFSAAFLRGLRRWLALGVVAWCVGTSLVFVDETEFVIVETLGQISAVYDHVTPESSDRGLHLKWPWPVGLARRFDRRQQVFGLAGRELFTQDKKNLTVSTYLLWRIPPTLAATTPFDERPVVRFFRGLGDRATAEARLEARTRALLAIEMSRVDLAQLLTAATPEARPELQQPLASLAARVLSEIRGEGAVRDSYAEKLGLEIVDLGIHRLNLPEGNRYAVYERMRTERERMAERYRAAGRAEKARLESLARRQADEILAKANTAAETIRSTGEAEALTILQQAWARDPELYEFQRALSAYSKILGTRTTLILSTSSRVLKLLGEGPPVELSKEAAGELKPAAAPSTPAKPAQP